jgi:cob(I)alamin adenosyltransferase
MKADIELHQRMRQHFAERDGSPTGQAAPEKEKGLLIIFTGTGKGKSSAAFGMGLRVLSHKMKLGVVQFIGSAAGSAEQRMLGANPNCDFQVACADCTWHSKDRNADMVTVAKGWAEAKRMIDDPSYHMVILDDLNLLLKYQYVSLDQVMKVFKQRREMLHIVVTGRHAPFELTDSADLVSEMRPLKHPYPQQQFQQHQHQQSIRAQRGIEY